MSAVSRGIWHTLEIVETSISGPAAILDTHDRHGSTPRDAAAARFERILQLQRQAVYPLDPVAAARAQSQLAHVEVPWLTRQLQETLTRLDDLTGPG